MLSLTPMKTKLIVVSLLCICAKAPAQSNIDSYIFGHSLIDHRPPLIPTPNDETTVPYWMADIAAEAGVNFACGGQYGFLPTHANLPPLANWGWDGVTPSWDDDYETFEEADINTVMITAGNFIQYQPAHLEHPIDPSTTALDATMSIFDWVEDRTEECDYYIYANWPEMDLDQAFPPTPPRQDEMDFFYDQTLGEFQDWWLDYQDSMIIRRPDMNPRMIPAGMIIAKIHRDLLDTTIPFDELYEDSAPHGRATTYFLSALVCYMSMYEEKIPDSYMPSDQVHVDIRNNLETVVDFIWDELLAFNDEEGNSRVFRRTVTAVDNVELSETEISLVPNPSRNHVEISGQLDDYSIGILDSEGTVYSTLDGSNGTISIDISDLPSGLYFVRIAHTNQATLRVERILKQ